MFKKLTKLRTFNANFICTNHSKRTSGTIDISKKDDYYKNLGDAEENIDVKPPEWDKALPYESIPGPKPLPLIGNIFRFLPFIGEYYNLPMKELHEAQGVDWFKVRSLVNPVLMQPKTAQQYIGSMDKVTNELIKNIRFFSTQNEKSEMPEDFQNELYKWALESIGFLTLNKHLGCLDLNAPKDSEPQKLIWSVNQMFLLMHNLEIMPATWKYIETPSWKRLVTVLDYVTETLSRNIEETLNKTIPEDVPDEQLNILQRLSKLDKRMAFSMVIDLFISGIDSSGKTIAAALYLLAKNPDKQKYLREEVYNNLPDKNSPITKEILNNSPYLKAVIKETTRIAPVFPGSSRTTIKDSVLGGYRIPKGTEVISMHIISANSEHFKDHEKFIPERWLRTEDSDYSYKNVHPFASQPFGFGPRSCVGKRLANLELEVAISKIIRNFELSWHHEDMVFSGLFLYGIERPLRIRVKEV
ncbi:cytochrome P450 CYP12A2-like isoform X2 [Anoplophora glabripennis]|uniref:cytochrome P450 CYP12A2-like isoform X2 n=1 Tax=Anoplophora glabripennis TaxID=217634 RepID=UPI000C76A5FD|nr:cytochrome P450 CYP12A2-like isoform X2 [Anoplophora glabripennis]